MMLIEGVEVRLKDVNLEDPKDKVPLTMDEIKEYITAIAQGHPGKTLRSLEIRKDNDPEYLNIRYSLTGGKPFERIRRITGYLVGTLDNWNDAKRAEERDRVKHFTGKPDTDFIGKPDMYGIE